MIAILSQDRVLFTKQNYFNRKISYVSRTFYDDDVAGHFNVRTHTEEDKHTNMLKL